MPIFAAFLQQRWIFLQLVLFGINSGLKVLFISYDV